MFAIRFARLARLLNVARGRGDLLAIAVLETMLGVPRTDRVRAPA